jgi:hypothetical protein
MLLDLATIRCGRTAVTMSRGLTTIVIMNRGPTANMGRGPTTTKTELSQLRVTVPQAVLIAFKRSCWSSVPLASSRDAFRTRWIAKDVVP